MTEATSSPLGWEDLKDEAVLKSLFTSDNGIDLDYSPRIHVDGGDITLDGRKLAPPRDLRDRLAYQEVAYTAACYIHEGAINGFARLPDKRGSIRLKSSLAERQIARGLVVAVQQALKEELQDELDAENVAIAAEQEAAAEGLDTFPSGVSI